MNDTEKRALARATFAVAAAMIAAAIVFHYAPRRISEVNARRIRLGMSKEQVEMFLGREALGDEKWIPFILGKTEKLEREGIPLQPTFWIGADAVIVVDFDESGLARRIDARSVEPQTHGNWWESKRRRWRYRVQ
jgi:hypothetical protein